MQRTLLGVSVGSALQGADAALVRAAGIGLDVSPRVEKTVRVAAKAPDGVIEAIESTDPNWFCVGVQWHPEAETASALDVQIFDCFVQAAVRASDGVLAVA